MIQARTQPESYDAWLIDFRWLEVHGAAKTLGTVAHARPRINTNAMTAQLQRERERNWPFLRGEQ